MAQSYDLGEGRLAWEMPFERAIALVWDRQFSTIAIAPDRRLAEQLADYASLGN